MIYLRYNSLNPTQTPVRSYDQISKILNVSSTTIFVNIQKFEKLGRAGLMDGRFINGGAAGLKRELILGKLQTENGALN